MARPAARPGGTTPAPRRTWTARRGRGRRRHPLAGCRTAGRPRSAPRLGTRTVVRSMPAPSTRRRLAPGESGPTLPAALATAASPRSGQRWPASSNPRLTTMTGPARPAHLPWPHHRPGPRHDTRGVAYLGHDGRLRCEAALPVRRQGPACPHEAPRRRRFHSAHRRLRSELVPLQRLFERIAAVLRKDGRQVLRAHGLLRRLRVRLHDARTILAVDDRLCGTIRPQVHVRARAGAGSGDQPHLALCTP